MSMRSRFILLCCLIALPLVTDILWAADAEIESPKVGVAPANDKAAGKARGGVGLVTLDPETNNRQTYINLSLPMDFRFWKLGLGLKGDVNLGQEGRIRTEDWDEASDWPRIVRYIEYGRKRETVYGRVGVLNDASLGHGTILHHFYSDIDYDHQKTGAQFDLNFDPGGFETITNNVIEPDVLGGRIYFRPLYATTIPIVRRLAFGASGVADVDAPLTLRGNSTATKQAITRDRALRALDSALSVYGFHAELPLLENSFIDLIPYADHNVIDEYGRGEHLGAMFRLKFPAITSDLTARFEWGKFDGGYIPRYFDAFYEIERFRYPELDSLTTKQQFLLQQEPLEGYWGELGWAQEGVFKLSGEFSDYDDVENGTLGLRLDILALKDAEFSARYLKRGVRSGEELITFDDHSLFQYTMSYPMPGVPFAYASDTMTRTWILDPNTGKYEPVDSYAPGVFFQIKF